MKQWQKDFSDITDTTGDEAAAIEERRRQRLQNAKKRRQEKARQRRELEAAARGQQQGPESGDPPQVQAVADSNNDSGTPIISKSQVVQQSASPAPVEGASLEAPAQADQLVIAAVPNGQGKDTTSVEQTPAVPAPVVRSVAGTPNEKPSPPKKRRARKKPAPPQELVSFKGLYKGKTSMRYLQVTVLEAQMTTDSDTIQKVNTALEEQDINSLLPKQLRVKVGKESKFTSVQHAQVGGSKNNVLYWVWPESEGSSNSCKMQIPEGTKYASFEMISDARPIRRKLLLSSLASYSKPGTEEDLWFDLKTPSKKAAVTGDTEHIKVHLKLKMWKMKAPTGNTGAVCSEDEEHEEQSTAPTQHKDQNTNIKVVKAVPTKPDFLSSCSISQLRLKNAELCQVLNVPKLNEHSEPMSMKNISVNECNSFMIHEFAADLVQHRQESEALFDQLSGGGRQSARATSGKVDVDIEMSVLMLAGDGRLRSSKEMQALHEDLLPLLELEELDPRNKLMQSDAEALSARDLPMGGEGGSAASHMQYRPHLAQLLNEWFARGIAGAVARSAEKGRGVCVVDSGYETELLSRFSHHLAMWRLPTLRIVGAALNGDNIKPVKAERLDVNHSHFVVCARPENLRGMGTDMSMCRVSAGVEAAEKLSSAFQQTKEALLTVQAAMKRMQRDQEMIELQRLQPAEKRVRFGDDMKGGSSSSSSSSSPAKIYPGPDGPSSFASAPSKVDRTQARRATMLDGVTGMVGLKANKDNNSDSKSNPKHFIKNVPKVCLLINGGERAKIDVLQAVRHGWDIIVVKGTGGLADWVALNAEILRRQQMGPLDGVKDKKKERERQEESGGIPKKLLPPFDPVVDEIVSYGKMTVLSLQHDSVEDVARLLAARLNRSERMLGERDAILEHAWQQYGTFHASAKEEGWWNSALSQAYIFLSLLTTFLAVVAMQVQHSGESSRVYSNVSTAIAIAPICLAVVTAIKSRFHDAQRWMRMHWIAEQIHREIFLYRTHSAQYQQPRFRRQQMAKRLGDCERSLMGSEASYAKLVDLDAVYSTDWLYKPKVRAVVLGLSTADDILQPLPAEQYVKHRLGERLQHFRQEANSNNSKLSWFSWSSYLLGGASTLLVMLGALQWAALTVAMQFMLSTLISTEAFEVSMVRANSTSMALAQIKDWWDALGETEQMEMVNRQTLTKSTERVLDNHMNGWLAAMNVGNDNVEDEDDDGAGTTTPSGSGSDKKTDGALSSSTNLNLAASASANWTARGTGTARDRDRDRDRGEPISPLEYPTRTLDLKDGASDVTDGNFNFSPTGPVQVQVPDLRLGTLHAHALDQVDMVPDQAGGESDEEEYNLKTARSVREEAEYGTYTARGDGLETSRVAEMEISMNPHTYRQGDSQSGMGPGGYDYTYDHDSDGNTAPALEGGGQYEETAAGNPNSTQLVEKSAGATPVETSVVVSQAGSAVLPMQEFAVVNTNNTTNNTDDEKTVKSFQSKSRLIKMLVNWARMCMPHRQGQANQLSTSLAAKRGGNCELRLTMRSGAHANAMILPNTTDFRAVPEHTVHKFMLRDLFTFLRVSAMQEAQKHRHEAEQVAEHHRQQIAAGDDTVATVGLGVIVVAGEGDFAAFPPAPGSIAPSGGKRSSADMTVTRIVDANNMSKHQRTIGEKRLRQFLCRGLPDAIKRLAERHVGVVLIDSGKDSVVTSLMTNSLSSWGFPGVRVLGVLESEDGHPDFSKVDMKHTHFISLKQRRTTEEVQFADCGIRETSAKVDVAHKLGHCFCNESLTKVNGGDRSGASGGGGSLYDNVIPVPYNQYMQPTNISLYQPGEEDGNAEVALTSNVTKTALLRDVSGSRLRDSFATGRRNLVLSGHLRRAVEDSGKTEVAPKDMQWSMPDPLLHLIHGPPSSQSRNSNSNSTPDFPVMKVNPQRFLNAAVEYAGASSVSDSSARRYAEDTVANNGTMLMNSDIQKTFQRTIRVDSLLDNGADDTKQAVRVAPSSYLMMLIGGGEKARVDCMQACRLGWDLLVFQGTGGLADEIASELTRLKANAAKSDGRTVASSSSSGGGGDSESAGLDGFNADGQSNDQGGSSGEDQGPGPVVEEIISTGKIALISVWEQGDSIEEVANVVHSRLQKDVNVFSGDPARGARLEHVLLHAWTLFAEYLLSARKLKRRSYMLEGAMMSLALLTTLLVAWDSDLRFNDAHWSESTRDSYKSTGAGPLQVFAALAPVLISVMLSVKNKFNFVAKYTAFAEAASAIKREIFEYRTNTDNYRDPTRRNHQLALRLKEITNDLLSTEASAVGVDQLTDRINLRDSTFRQQVLELHPDDDGVCNIDVSEYLEYRMEFQLDKYRRQTRWLHLALKVLTYFGYTFTGLCTALVLINEQVWVVCIIMLLNVTANIVAIGMLEDRLMRTNDAIVALHVNGSKWNTLSEGDQIKYSLVDKCVSTSENVIMAHTLGGLPRQAQHRIDMDAVGGSEAGAPAQA